MRRTGFFLCIALGLSLSVTHAEAAPSRVLDAKSSWIGNTFGFGNGAWTQINITAIAVAPDGRVFTNSPWDESGAEASVYRDGQMLGYAGGTHGWGAAGGNAVAVNSRYVYVAVGVGNEKGRLVKEGVWPRSGRHWIGVTRRDIGDMKRPAPFEDGIAQKALANDKDSRAVLARSFLTINDTPDDARQDIGGLAASDALLYVANTSQDRIELYDAASMQKKSQWSAPQPGRIALGADGSLWAIVESRGEHPRVVHYGASGQTLSDAPRLAADSMAVDIALDKQGRVLVADNGPRQQVLFFAKEGSVYRESSALGERGGIFSGVAGKPGPRRFNGLTGVGVDAAGNVYVSANGIGTHDGPIGAGLGATLESYAPDGTLRWQMQGLLFVDGAWIDPGRPDSVYTGNKRFELDLSKPAGQEWKYAGFLSGRFRYPDDPVFHVDQWPGLPIARRLDGRTFLYLTDMYADHLKIYRFDAKRDGELAIPSGFIAGRPRPVQNVPNRPEGGEWIWRDQNGDGRFDTGEFQRNPGAARITGGWGWWVDIKGDIWRTSDVKGIHRLRYGGLDKQGNPVYDYANMQTYPVPAPFTELRRAVYDAASDTMYVTGYTADEPYDRRYWKEVGRRFVRYDHWSSDARARYSIDLPWDTQAKPLSTVIGITVEGQYVFAVEPVGDVHVYDKDSGREVGVIKPGAEVGHASGWVDVPNGVSAHRRGNGEYLVFVEEDARGKVMMYRWTPQS
ncbi:NHL repeat-containing protein [Caballeronia insecticola]|uniref:Putative exported protein n=1 Tax=Caballeronia insecticola TaxID=758793 RepID=R4WTV0_9BURK|nr:putative exported protein [Caballeronia insecticola]